MPELHPEDVELLELVEDELPAERRSVVSAHVAGCVRCAESVRLLEAGKAALREAPRLELAPERREALVAGLPDRPARRRRAAARAFAVLAPVAAVVALVVTLASLDTGMEEEAKQGGEAAPAAREQAATAEAEAGAEEDTSATSLQALPSVAGPADDVAELLRQRGFDARVVGDHVEVRNAKPDAVERALADRRPGAVRVVVR